MIDWGVYYFDIVNWVIGLLVIVVLGEVRFFIVEDGYNVLIDYCVSYEFVNGV